MAAEVGGLLVNLGLDVAAIRKDVGRANRELSGFRNKVDRQMSKVQRSFKRATSGLKGLVAVVGIGKLSSQINSVVDSTNRLAKSAKTADLTAESLQELRFAFGQLADVTDKQVDTALQKFTRRLGLAKDETGAAADTFGEIGVAITDATGKLRDSEPVLDDVLRSLGSMESDALRAAKASEIFGEEVGPKLAAALDGGVKNMEEARQKAHDLGLVLSDDLVGGAEGAADKLDIMQKRMGKEFQRMILENKSAIMDLSEAFTTIAESIITATREAVNFTKWLSESLAASIHGIAADDLPRLNGRLKEIQSTLEESANGRFQLSQKRKEELEDEAERLRKLIRLERKRREEMNRDIERPDLSADGGGGTGNRGGGSSRSGSGSVVFPSMTRGGRRTGSQFEQLIQIQNEAESAADSMERSGDTIIGVQNNIRDNQIEVNQTFERTGDIVASSLARAADEGRDLQGVLQGLARDLSRMLVRQGANEIGSSVTGALSAAFGGATSSGGSSAGVAASTPRSFAGGGHTGDGPRSGGLDGQGGFMAMLHPRERVVDETKGGGGNTYNIDARGADQAAIARLERTIKAVNGSIERRAVSAVGSQRQRSFRG